MCLGIVGQIVTFSDEHPDLAEVKVAGAVRKINIGILGRDALQPGDFILIHAGMAMEKIDEETAKNQACALADYTGNSLPDDFDFKNFDFEEELS